VETTDNILGIEQGNAELERLMAADAAAEAEQTTAKPGETTEDSATAAQRAGQTEKVESTESPESKTTDTPTAASEKTAEQKAAEQKAAEAKAKESPQKNAETAKPGESRFAKAQERQKRSWDELNAQKEALKAEKDAFEKERAEHAKAREAAEKEFSPEAYDEAARKFEEQGKFDLAELAKAKAAELRKNPPKSPRENAEIANAEQAKQSKEWALKAGIDFPELAKTNSPLQVRVAQLFKEEPDLKAHPKGIYVAARIASLEAAAAGVTEKDKELGTLRARVKELEKLTSPGGGGSAAAIAAGEKPFEQKSEEEQLAELQKEALELGVLNR